MRVQRLVTPGDGRRSWTVVDDDGMPVEPVESYLAYLTAIERSPNTVRAYATSLRFWFEFCDRRGVAWDRARVEDVARFVGDLRAPGGQCDRARRQRVGAVTSDGEPSSRGPVRLL